MPRAVRLRIGIALLYNIQAFNLIPDFVPVIGLVDNIVVTVWALPAGLRAAGPEAVARHWNGTSDGLALVCRLAAVSPARTSYPIRAPHGS